jgi:hypothetical protein
MSKKKQPKPPVPAPIPIDDGAENHELPEHHIPTLGKIIEQERKKQEDEQ